MAVRKDKIQLEVEINGKKAGKTYNELNRDARNLQRELRNLVPGTDAFIKKSAELKKVNSRLADIRAKTKGVAQGLNQMRTVGARVPGVFRRIGNALNSIAALAVIGTIIQFGRALVDLGKESLTLFDIQAKADAQLKASLQSTSEAAGRSFEQLKQQATDLQGLTLFGDEATQGAQSVLLTFTNVREEIFDRALPAVLDMSTALKTDLKSSAIQIGKALNDPVKGISALSRAGIQFTDDQKQLIKSLSETGRTAEAQTIILKELETQFGGSAEAAAKAGLGPYTQLGNKLGDLKESVGLLIEKGLKLLAPILNTVVDFAQKFVGSLLSGEKATGKFSTGVNILVTVLKGIFKAFQVYLSFQKQLIAGFSGIIAGVVQLGQNIVAKFRELKLAAELFGKEIDLAFSFKDGTKEKLRREIQDLSQLKADAALSGKTVGEAFAEARNKSLGNLTFSDSSDTDSGSDRFVPSASVPSENSSIGPTGSDTFKKVFDQRIKAAKAAFDKESLLLEQARIKNDVTEQEFGEQTLELKRAFYQNQLEVFKAFGQEQEAEAIKLQNNLLEIEKIKPSDGSNPRKVDEVAALPTLEPTQVEQGADSKIDDLTAQSERELEILEEKFLRALISEQEYNLAVLETKAAGFEEQLLFLQEAGLVETEQYREVQLEKLRVGKEIDIQRVQNAKRTQELEAKVQMQGFESAKEIFELGAGLLDEDTKARGKHAAVIKAFEVAKVAVDVQSEIASIWRNAQNSIAAKVLGPTAGTAIAIIQTAFAVARTQIRLRKIASAKFAEGGKVKHSMPTYSGQHIADDANIPEQSNGDNILAFVRKGEVILNERQQAALGGSPVFKRIGVPGFADGGLVTVNTTPVVQDLNLNNPSQSADNSELITEMRLTRAAIERIPTNLRAFVVYNDIEDAATEINNVRDEANF